MILLPGFAPLAQEYDGFILDLWGVIHDGIAPYDGALDCLQRLVGRPVLLLSNAPRRRTPCAARCAASALPTASTPTFSPAAKPPGRR